MMMKLDVRLFARARDLAGADAIELEVPATACVADVRSALAERFPTMRPLVPHLLVAVDAQYAHDSEPLDSGAMVACFPPVSGG